VRSRFSFLARCSTEAAAVAPGLNFGEAHMKETTAHRERLGQSASVGADFVLLVPGPDAGRRLPDHFLVLVQ
jgi:hypothetical protein